MVRQGLGNLFTFFTFYNFLCSRNKHTPALDREQLSWEWKRASKRCQTERQRQVTRMACYQDTEHRECSRAVFPTGCLGSPFSSTEAVFRKALCYTQARLPQAHLPFSALANSETSVGYQPSPVCHLPRNLCLCG